MSIIAKINAAIGRLNTEKNMVVIEFYTKSEAMYCMHILKHFKLNVCLDVVRLLPCGAVEKYKVYIKYWNVLSMNGLSL